MKTHALASFLLFSFLISSCGGGGAASSAPSLEEIVTLLADATTSLEAGDVESAEAAYDLVLSGDPHNATAAFGSALSKMLLLSTSKPSNKIMEGLGYNPIKMSQILGETSYLSALNNYNEVDATIDGVEGPFTGHARLSDVPECGYEYVTFEIKNLNKTIDIKLDLMIAFSGASDSGLGAFELKAGDVISLDQVNPNGRCRGQSVYFRVYHQDGDFYTLNPDAAVGQITINSIDGQEGGSVDFSINASLYDWRSHEVFDLVANVSDSIITELPKAKDYLPFFGQKGGLGEFLANAQDGLKIEDFQSYVQGYVSLIEEINALLEIADQSDDFQFVIPKAMYFGSDDILVNRTDLKTIRASMHLSLVGLYLSNSWECDMEVGSLYDSNGLITTDTATIVDQLNECFSLKSGHQVSEAEQEFAKSLQLLQEALTALETTTSDGIIEPSEGTEAGFAELETLVQTAVDSLTSSQTFTLADPNVSVHLGEFFANPPQRDDVSTDPFVLENGKIKPVELFFKEQLEGIVDYNLGTSYKSLVADLNGHFSSLIFDEFNPFFLGGQDVVD